MALASAYWPRLKRYHQLFTSAAQNWALVMAAASCDGPMATLPAATAATIAATIAPTRTRRVMDARRCRIVMTGSLRRAAPHLGAVGPASPRPPDASSATMPIARSAVTTRRLGIRAERSPRVGLRSPETGGGPVATIARRP